MHCTFKHCAAYYLFQLIDFSTYCKLFGNQIQLSSDGYFGYFVMFPCIYVDFVCSKYLRSGISIWRFHRFVFKMHKLNVTIVYIK